MIIECPSCKSKYKYPDEKFEGQPSKKVKCANCQDVFEIQNPSLPGAKKEDSTGQIVSKTKRIDSQRSISKEDAALHGIPLLPQDRKLSVTILSGSLSGSVFPIGKPVFTIGRSNADLSLGDPEASRLHAQIEIHGTKYILKDLDSTNGTFLGNKRVVKETEIDNLTEFRIGTTTLMFVETQVE